MGIIVADFVNFVVDPICQDLAANAGVAYPPAARTLMLGTAAQETQIGTYLRQQNEGPAVGVFQMEKATATDLWDNFIVPQARFKPVVDRYYAPFPCQDQIEWNLALAALFARLYYFRIAAPLPGNTMEGVWEYYKKYWNTPAGAATRNEFMRNMKLLGTYIPPG